MCSVICKSYSFEMNSKVECILSDFNTFYKRTDECLCSKVGGGLPVESLCIMSIIFVSMV